MSATEFAPPVVNVAVAEDSRFNRDLLAHLREQMRSAERILRVVQTQGSAIRARDTKSVVATACELQVEISRREVIENERMALMVRGGVLLGCEADQVTMTALIDLMDENDAHATRERQLNLKRLLRIVQREHTTNQALMRQELNFLSHLLGLAGSTGAYGSSGQRPSVRRRSLPGAIPTLDLEA